ncbi:MAG: PEP-CTERM system TPR-repeat protein PrsT [Rhodoferax sp.]|nr:PEP-CTERM system TPR-repeat protein PrsT [Rhodoferax sp.]
MSVFKSRSRLGALALAMLLVACGADKPDAMLASARDYLAKNDPKAAVIQIKNALQVNPELPEARFLLGQALLKSGDPVGAETELRKAMTLKHPQEAVIPLLAQAMLLQRQFKKVVDEFSAIELSQPSAQANLKTSLALAHLVLGKPDLAQAAMMAALAADPTYMPALLYQARGKAIQGDVDGALVATEAILGKTPSSHEAWKLKGDLLMSGKGKPDEALAAYRKAVEAKPDYADARMAIMSTLMRQEKLEEASKQMAELKKIFPNAVQTRYFETLLAYQKKDFKQARELAQQLVKLVPDNVLVLQLAGALELRFNSLLQAEVFLAKALQSAPDSLHGRRLLASTYLRSGQSAKALATLQPALKGDNLDPATNAIAGEVYLQNGDTKKAEDYFNRAVTQNPKNDNARTALALTRLASGREDAGLAELQDVAASEVGTTATMALISAHLRRKEYDKAIAAIDALEKKQPEKPLPANLRGRTLLAKNDVAGARKNFERSVAIDPLYFPSVAALAALDMAEKKPDEARKRFDAVLAKDPKNGQALLALAELRARAGGPKAEVAELITRAVTANPTEPGPRLLLIDFHLRSKDFKQAVAVAQNAVAAIPENAELLDGLGRAQQASGETNQALATFKKVAAMQPQSPIPQMRLADAYMADKNKVAAAQALRKALEIKPDMLAAERGLVLLALDAKNYDEALRISRGVQKQSPKEVAGYMFEGDIAANQKKWDVAANAYQAGLKQTGSPQFAIKLHAVYTAAGKPANAEKLTATWLKDNPKDVLYRTYLGDGSLAKNDLAAAERQYQAVVQNQPQNAVALNNLAWITGKLKKEGGIAYAEKAIALAPNQPAFMDTLAVLYSDRNDYAKALEWQTKALALQPQNAIYKLNMAKIHIKGGKKDLARKDLDELAKLGDKFGGQSDVATLLKGL